VDPIPDPLLLRISGSAENRTGDLWICSQELWPLDQRGGRFNIIIHNYYSHSEHRSSNGTVGSKDEVVSVLTNLHAHKNIGGVKVSLHAFTDHVGSSVKLLTCIRNGSNPPPILTEVFRGFPQSFVANSRTMSRLGHYIPNHFQLMYHPKIRGYIIYVYKSTHF
jgi:hypothetical protein